MSRRQAEWAWRFKLVHGPYHAPLIPKSGYLRCERRGPVRVGHYSEAPIPWPCKWKTDSPILCGDLVRAVRHEALASVAFHWGVSKTTVYTWRSTLGACRWNAGSTALLLASRAVRKRMGRDSPQAKGVYEIVRDENPRRQSPSFRRMMSKLAQQRLENDGTLNPNQKKWTRREEQLLGRFRDAEIARRIGRSTRAVRMRRLSRGIPCPGASYRFWKPEEETIVGTKADREIAQVLGRSVRSVIHRRLKLRRPPPTKLHRRWAAHEITLLGKLSDAQIAGRTGRTLSSIKGKRVKLGIRTIGARERAWKSWEDKLVCRLKPKEAAARLNRSNFAILHRRRFLGLRPLFRVLNNRPWTQEELRLLGTMPDEALATKIGRTRVGVRQKRRLLRIPLYSGIAAK